MSANKHIINCHIHTFTADHVPENFLPFGLNTALKIPVVRKPLAWLLSGIIFWDRRDQLQRYANFMEAANKRSQRQIYEEVRGRYPRGSRFVVLPMDMEFMGAGRLPKSLGVQHDELATLRDVYPEEVIPFVAIDPRRRDLLAMVKSCVEEKGFGGLKLYPNLGYAPNDPALESVWQYAEANGLPVMSHCSRGGVRHKDYSKDDVSRVNGPAKYLEILKKYPKLRLCLAHFGGQSDWEEYFAKTWDPANKSTDQNWLGQILDLLREENFPNLYVDISYTIFNYEEYAPALKVFLTDSRIARRTLFGSDYYMIEQERFEERLLSMRLRAELGEDLFWQVAYKNPVEWLTGVTPS